MTRFCGNCFNESLNEQNICTICGFDCEANRNMAPHGLPAGSILNGRYIIGKILGQGGFGITYTARDHQTGQIVAVKEFFPDSMAIRSTVTEVTPFQGERGENFAYGKETFLQEAETMAKFIGNPNIVRVYSYFEENGTAYFVMEYVDGVSYLSYLKSKGGKIPVSEALDILYPVMDALSAVHEKNIIHRDVTPDNIYISRDGVVKLLDFGAARYSLGNASRSLDVILKHGFAPREQYKRRGRQGPFTDVYALAATLYYSITGIRPDDALERLDEDIVAKPSVLGVEISKGQEAALMKAMAVDPENRFQTMKEFRNALQKASINPDDKTKVVIPKKKPVKQTETKPTAEQKSLPKWLIPVTSGMLALLMVVMLITSIKQKPEQQMTATKAPMQTVSTEITIFKETEPVETAPTVDITKNILMSVGKEPYPSDRVFGYRGDSIHSIPLSREDVRSITFLDTLENAPENALDVSELENGQVLAWTDLKYDLYIAAEGGVIAPEDSSYLFAKMESLQFINFGNAFDTSNVKKMSYMFMETHRLAKIDLSGFDTSNVTDMSGMFAKTSFSSLDLSSFDTSKVTDFSAMFWDSTSLSDINMSSFNTESATDMGGMFSRCLRIKNLDLTNFDTSNVTNMRSMFDTSTLLEQTILLN